MNRNSLLAIILAALAAGAVAAAAYLTLTRYGRFLTILGAIVAIAHAPEGTVGATIVQDILHALNPAA